MYSVNFSNNTYNIQVRYVDEFHETLFSDQNAKNKGRTVDVTTQWQASLKVQPLQASLFN